MNDSDFIISNDGSVWRFQPVTQRAKNFTDTELGLESWQWLGPAFVIDANLAQQLMSSLEDEGFILEL